jgi:hypothetical protein
MTGRRGSLLLDGVRPKEAATATERLKWLRAQIRLFARDLAMLEMFGGVNPDGAEDQLGLVADGFADLIGIPDDVVRMAVVAEQQDAAALIAKCADQLHRRVFLLGREHAPGREILAAAESICERLGVFMPAPLMLDRVRAIARQAAAPRRRRHAA